MTLQHSLVHSIRLVWPMQLARVLLCPQLIFPFKTSFFGIYLEFSAPEITLKINISHVFESKSYQINSIKSYSSRSFHQHQRHKPGLRPGLGTSSGDVAAAAPLLVFFFTPPHHHRHRFCHRKCRGRFCRLLQQNCRVCAELSRHRQNK